MSPEILSLQSNIPLLASSIVRVRLSSWLLDQLLFPSPDGRNYSEDSRKQAVFSVFGLLLGTQAYLWFAMYDWRKVQGKPLGWREIVPFESRSRKSMTVSNGN